MSRRGLVVVGLAVAAMVVAGDVLAQDQTQQRFDGIITQFRDQSIRWQGVLTISARWLFFTLAIMQFAWTNMTLALKGGDISDFISQNTKQILGIGIMYVFLLHAFEWSTALVMGFRQAGERAVIASAGAGAESSIDPAGIFQNGMIVAGSLFSQISVWQGADNLALVICALVIIVCFALLAAFMAVAIVESYIIIGGSVLFLGFGGSGWTGDIARKTMMYAVSVGAKLFVMQLIVGVAMGSVVAWAQTYEQDSSTSTMSLIGLVILITIMAKMIPELMQGILSGVSVGGTSAMVATIGAATAAAAAGGAAAFAGGASGAAATGALGGTAAAAGGAAAAGALGGAAAVAMHSGAGGAALGMGSSGLASAAGQVLGPLSAVGRQSDAPIGAAPGATAAKDRGSMGAGAGTSAGAGAPRSGATGRDAGSAEETRGSGATGPAGSDADSSSSVQSGGSEAISASGDAAASQTNGESESGADKGVPSGAAGGPVGAAGVSPSSPVDGAGVRSLDDRVQGEEGGSSDSAAQDEAAGVGSGAEGSETAGASAPGGDPVSLNERGAQGPEPPKPGMRAFSSATGDLVKMAGHILDTGSGFNPGGALAPIAQLAAARSQEADEQASSPATAAESAGGVIRGAGSESAPRTDEVAGAGDDGTRLKHAKRGAAIGLLTAGPGGAAIGAAIGAAASSQLDGVGKRARSALDAARSRFGIGKPSDTPSKPS